MSKTIAVITTLDTKGKEAAYVRSVIERLGHRALMVDVGVKEEPPFTPDIKREEISLSAGEPWEKIKNRDKRERILTMTKGLTRLIPLLYAQGRFDAVLSMGGAQNTSMGTSAMRALPLGVPKVMVSTVTSGHRTFEPYMGIRDLFLLHSVADISGINLVTRTVLENAVAAVCGMAEHAGIPMQSERFVVGATMLGVTDEGVSRMAGLLEQRGMEVVTFHANGVGGRAMEELVKQGVIGAVADLTLHEVVSELFGGYCAGAVGRLEAAGNAGIPQVVAPGAADVVDYAESELAHLPDWSQRKRIYQHPTILHLKLLPAEAAKLGEVVAARLNKSRGPVTVVIPRLGFHQMSYPGGPLWQPETDEALIRVFTANLRPDIQVREVDANINDPCFSQAAAGALFELLGKRY